MVTLGSVSRRHYVGVIEEGRQFLIGPFSSAEDAWAKAAAECERLSLPRAYVGIRSGL
jgi:hypothetical protein